jgi:hypothetical protein
MTQQEKHEYLAERLFGYERSFYENGVSIVHWCPDFTQQWVLVVEKLLCRDIPLNLGTDVVKNKWGFHCLISAKKIVKSFSSRCIGEAVVNATVQYLQAVGQ